MTTLVMAYENCLDYAMPDQLGHYCAVLTGVARLAGQPAHSGLTDRHTGICA
ncbi:hypothetical protein [Mycolicibacterium neoaurum]|uniref:hypothetical protein n=1 Tax=Mycolicibacterium neoaurum TaxID=1795 RepID=UPI001F4CB892|nr:hypothetical protein [Mycolicibacterium neoaurum]